MQIPVIETYQQLAGIVLALTCVAVIARLVWLRRRHGAVSTAPASQQIEISKREPTRRGSPAIEFDKLASYISNAGTRAEHVAHTQSAAALKLDTVEVAVNRLVADMNGIMDVPRAAIPPAAVIAVTQAPAAPRASIAA